MTRPDLSIIISLYNGRQTVFDTVRSALTQSGPSIQVIVINDGSTDDSEEVLSRAGFLERVVYLSQENRGVSVARNNALCYATGRYVNFLDQDDLLQPSFAATMVQLLVSRGTRIGYCNYEYFLHDAPDRKVDLSYPKYEGEVGGRILSEHFIPTTGAVVLEKDLAETVRFHPDVQGPEDWLYWIELLLKEPISYCPERLIRIRIRKNSLSRCKNRMSQELIKVMEKAEFLLSRSAGAGLTKQDLAKFYFRYSGYLLDAGSYGKALQRWFTANTYHVHPASNFKLLAKIVLMLLALDRSVENVLWKLRTDCR